MDLTPAGKISISDFIEARMFYVFPREDSEDTTLINSTVIKYLNNLYSRTAIFILNLSSKIEQFDICCKMMKILQFCR